MIPTVMLLSLLVSFLPSSTLGSLTNEHIDLLSYAYVRAVDNGISPTNFIKLLECESGFNKNAWNKNDPYGGARGIAQFLEPTFNAYKKIYGLVGEYNSAYAQINLAASIIGDGGIKNWHWCGKKSGLLK